MLDASAVVATPFRTSTARQRQLTKPRAVCHPLDQLSGEEVLAVARLCKREAATQGLPLPIRFNYISAQVRLQHPLGCGL